jgi:hypothetical protein
MIRRPGYGDHLAATTDPGIHERQSAVLAPPGFADAIAWLAPTQEPEVPHWHVTFTVAPTATKQSLPQPNSAQPCSRPTTPKGPGTH